jgi:3-deoxy-D-manno-octulosonic-acid transferase
VTAGFWLLAYRIAWMAALPPIRVLAASNLLPRNWRVTERLSRRSPWPADARPLWMHCASLGEAKGLWALAGSLPPDLPVLLTASTASGADFLGRACADSGAARRARIAPLDHPRLLGDFLAGGRIRGLLSYEVELWPHALDACARLGLPAALAAGRLTPEALRAYRRFGGAAFRLLDGLAWIDAQSSADAARFAYAAAAPIHAGGDYKALASLPVGIPSGTATPGPAHPGPGRREVAHREAARPGFAFVSLHLAELRRLSPALQALADRHEVLIFPRRPEEMAAFAAALEPMGFARFSARPESRRLLVDAFGQVGALLPRCHTAFVGGSLVPLGCHNLWEPLAAGCRILFGPDYRHQRALAALLLARGLASIVEGPGDLDGLPAPAAGQVGACAELARDLRAGLDEALQACRERIIATFFADAPAPPAGREAGLAVPAGGEGFVP